jgi:hypothetical protein
MQPRAFWRSGVIEDPSLQNIHTPKWPLDRSDCIVTMGSCFAQHVGKKLSSIGFNVPYFDVENGIKSKAFSANYGNIYTVRQALQLLQEASGLLSRSEQIWETPDGFVDPFRPNVFIHPFQSVADLLESRKRHLIAVSSAIEKLDVLVFTLGLTEAWEAASCGGILPVVPGVLGGVFDEKKYIFRNFDYAQITSDLEKFIDEILKMRQGRKFRFLLTVSPVPLTATAENRHVLVSSVASKSILRSVADFLWRKHDFVDYFPSFEIITNPKSISENYEENLRTVKKSSVDFVMDIFELSYSNTSLHISTTKENSYNLEIDDVDCEEALLEQFSSHKDITTENSNSNLLFLGNSHLGFLRNALNQKLIDRSLFIPTNFLINKPFKNIKKEKFQRFIFKRTSQFSNIESHHCTYLVMVGLEIFGDGILRAIGPLKSGYEGCIGSDISVNMSDANLEPELLKQKFSKQINQKLRMLDTILKSCLFKKIIWIVSPDLTEQCARFRLGDKFVDSEEYLKLKELYLSIFNRLASPYSNSVTFIMHDENLFSNSGFVSSKFAEPPNKPWGIHPVADFYREQDISRKIQNALDTN